MNYNDCKITISTAQTLTPPTEPMHFIKNYSIVNKEALLLIICLFFLFSAKAQMCLTDVEVDKLNKGSIGAYLQAQIDKDIKTFTEVKPSLQTNSNTLGFQFHEREYLVKDSLHKVWSHYVNTNPAKAWNTNKLNFGFMYCKNGEEMVYPNEHVDKVATGQIIYLNLLLLQIKNIATAFEIITLNELKNVMEFSYVDDNITQGKQQLNFEQTSDGYTKIVHRSYFKSKSKVRDRYFYPFFHTRLTNSYHKNMKKLFIKGSLM